MRLNSFQPAGRTIVRRLRGVSEPKIRFSRHPRRGGSRADFPGSNRPMNQQMKRKRSNRKPADRATAERMLKLLQSGADARETKITRVKSSVDSSTYENDLKLSIAIDRLTKDL